MTIIQACALLLREYDNYDPFVDYCRRVSDLLRASLSDLAKKHQLLEETARRWNLHLVPEIIDMNYWHLEQAILQTGKRIGEYELKPFNGFTTMYFAATTSQSKGRAKLALAACRPAISRLATRLNHARPGRQPAQPAPRLVLRQLRALPEKARRAGWEFNDTPHELERHVRWLFLRLCPQPKEPLSVKEVLEGDAYADERTLRRTVAKLAKLLQIEMPTHNRDSRSGKGEF